MFIHTMTTVDSALLEQIGDATPALLLSSKAEVIDVVMLTRTGHFEYMLTTHPETRHEVFTWLDAHAWIGDNAGLVFADLGLTDETGSLVTIAVYGPDSSMIVDTLAAHGLDEVLGSGHSALCELDGIPAFVFTYPLLSEGYFELTVAPSLAPQLEAILLSFPELNPSSFDEYRAARLRAGTWFEGAEASKYHLVDSPQLTALVRMQHDFVGARALNQGGALPVDIG